MTCHRAGGPAGNTALLFVSGTGSANELENYNRLRNYVRSAANNGNVLLGKTIAQPAHTGGNLYGSSDSQQYKNLAELVPILQGNCPTPSPTPAPTPTPSATPTPTPPPASGFWSGVTLADNATTLAKAAILFASRNPTAAEYQAVATGGTAALRSTIRSYMQGPSFEAFLDETGDTMFMPQGVAPYANDVGISGVDFPALDAVLKDFRANSSALRTRFVTSIQREGVELMKYIVRTDRPWNQMVSGNYTMMNGLLADYFSNTVDGTFVDKTNDKEWLPGTWKSPRVGGAREHAGILSSHAWLARFPTSATNRNRHRVLMLGRQFLGVDIALAGLSIDDTDQTFLVPTLENPTCKGCHDSMDPIAAGFQNWNEANRYLPYNLSALGKNIALPPSYRASTYPKDASGQSYYKAGDNWFRDSVPPGYNGALMPGGFTGNTTALQWLGGKVAADTRFPMGAVHFWYQAVFGREPLAAPLKPDSSQYATQLAAYNAQHAEFSQFAAQFSANNFKVKDLLVDLVTSQWFRATTVSAANQTATRKAELSDVSASNMLPTGHLQRKLKALTGLGYSEFNNPYTNEGLSYGSFDGNLNTKRAKDHTISQTTTIDGLVTSMSCAITQADFAKTVANRLLFPQVVFTDTPATTAGEAAIVQNIRHLHRWLLKEDLPATDPEIQRTLKLFKDVWNDRNTAPPKSLVCAYTAANDPNYAGRAWAAVIAYLLGDPKFLFE